MPGKISLAGGDWYQCASRVIKRHLKQKQKLIMLLAHFQCINSRHALQPPPPPQKTEHSVRLKLFPHYSTHLLFLKALNVFPTDASMATAPLSVFLCNKF